MDKQKESKILLMNKSELSIYTLLMDAPARIKQCSRNSMICINKAWGLKDIDPEMAAFRAITAEEEAATAIIESLKARKYEGVKILNSREHPQKAAIWFIVSCSIKAFQVLDGKIKARCKIDKSSDGCTKLPRIEFQIVGQPFKEWFSPEPPFNFSVSMGDNENLNKQFIENEIKEYIEAKGKKDFRKYIRDEANLRNQLLYSSPAGVAKVDSDIVKFIESRRRRAILLLIVCTFVYCYSERQSFVQYVVDTLLSNISAKSG